MAKFVAIYQDYGSGRDKKLIIEKVGPEAYEDAEDFALNVGFSDPGCWELVEFREATEEEERQS